MTQTPAQRGRPPRTTPDTRTPEQRRNDRIANRHARGLAVAENLDKLPDLARVQLPAIGVLLAKSSVTIWRRIKEGKLPPLHADGAQRFYTAGELRSILKGGQ